MVQQITEGVSIGVEVFFLHEQSNPINNEYFFAYRITVGNLSKYPVRLQSRYWNILDSNGSHRVVEGEGVVGQQPIIGAGEQYQYTSACNLRTDIGKMYGYYIFENLFDKKTFKVAIPVFQLLAPFKLN